MDNTYRHEVVDRADWDVAHRRLLARERELTRARDPLAADRRRSRQKTGRTLLTDTARCRTIRG